MSTQAIPLSPARPTRAYLALVVGMLCISFTAIFTKWAHVPGPVSAAWRMTIAAVVLAAPFIRQARRWTPAARSGVPWGIAGGLSFGLNLGLLNTALLLTSAATATLLDNTAPIWVGIGAMLVFGERLKGWYWAGLALALTGAAVVTGFNPAAGFVPNRGDAIAFGGATFYATYLLVTQRGRRNLDSLSYLWLVVATSAVALTLASLVLHLPLFGYSIRSYASLIAVGIFSQAGGWLLINYALGYLPASTAVIVLLGQPVVTGLLSIPLLGEMLTARQVVGGLVVLTGIYLCLKRNGNG
ncbi:MAG: DMT family transporter [Chloroflexi bacterium]|nr:DMT family transporter [Chloroflexota bacterium]